MNSPNPKSDQELDDLLRDIEVPSDLKSKLQAIPGQFATNEPKPKNEKPLQTPSGTWFPFLLAASLLGIAAFLAWPFLHPATTPIVDRDPIDDSNPTDQAESPVIEQAPNLASIDELEATVQKTLADLEIRRLESRLRALNANQQNVMSQQEYTSMILALADQTVVDLGGSKATADASMVSIIQDYPDTRGAQIAKQFLGQNF